MTSWVCVQHVPHEGPAGWQDTLHDADLGLSVCRPDLGDRLPEPSDPDLAGLLVMGGPMHALSDADHPWLASERACLAEAHSIGVPIIAVCLGYQLLAAALGGAVSLGGHTELGIGRIDWTPRARLLLGHDLPALVLHWHDDAATPADGVRLAGTATTRWQATATGSSVAMQFHVEIRPQDLTTITPHLPAGMTIDGDALAASQSSWSRLRHRILRGVTAASRPPSRVDAHRRSSD